VVVAKPWRRGTRPRPTSIHGRAAVIGRWGTGLCPAFVALVALFLVLIAAGCAAPIRPSLAVLPIADPTPSAPRPITFPRDESPHDSLSEWWYYTGHLDTESGAHYGFELTFFQAVRGQNPVGYAAHFAITDPAGQRFSYEERLDKSLRVQGDGSYRLKLGDWQIGGDGADHYLQASGKDYSLDLKLHSLKPPALHAGKGWISFGPVGDSYYYSRTRMELSGSLGQAGKAEQVTGLAWMDHQWGDFILVNGGGWDWFSLQLGDGTELMVTVLRDQPGSVSAMYGSLVDREGGVTELRASDLEVEATGSWQSPHSGVSYPSGWRLRLPNQGLDLSLEPVLRDQELDTRASTGVRYWEGEVRASGSRNGAPISGLGYVELTGYAK